MIAAELALDVSATTSAFDSIESAHAPPYAGAARRPHRSFGGRLPDGALPVRRRRRPNSYDYRLVVSRKLYDRAVGTAMSPSLAPLAIGAGAHVHPLDLDRVGVADGTEVKLVGARGSVVLPVVADESVPARHALGAVQPGTGADITDLVDAGALGDRRADRAACDEPARRAVRQPTRCSTPTTGGAKVLAIVAAKVLVIFVIGLVGTMFMVWFERKIVSGMQNRIGPNKAGPWGLLQTLADGTKLFFKEDLLPDKADKWVFRLAPFLAFVPAFLVWSVIPLGGDFSRRQRRHGRRGSATSTRVQLVDPPVGHPDRAGAELDRRVRHHARRLGVGLEVPAARLGAGVGADDLVRGGARAEPGRGAADGGHVVDVGHRRRARTASPTGTSSPPASSRSSCS